MKSLVALLILLSAGSTAFAGASKCSPPLSRVMYDNSHEKISRALMKALTTPSAFPTKAFIVIDRTQGSLKNFKEKIDRMKAASYDDKFKIIEIENPRRGMRGLQVEVSVASAFEIARMDEVVWMATAINHETIKAFAQAREKAYEAQQADIQKGYALRAQVSELTARKNEILTELGEMSSQGQGSQASNLRQELRDVESTIEHLYNQIAKLES